MAVAFEHYWCSNKDWVEFGDDDLAVRVRDDAPEEAKESYRLYLRQLKEYHKWKEDFFNQLSLERDDVD